MDQKSHLGLTLTNQGEFLDKDMQIKKARYVSKNIEINQEMHFAAAETKLTVNSICNSSWFGSVLWNRFNPATTQIYSSSNRSVKVMLKLPYSTHRGLIEPLTNQKTSKMVLVKRFLEMVAKIRLTKKPILKVLLAPAERDIKQQQGKI